MWKLDVGPICTWRAWQTDALSDEPVPTESTADMKAQTKNTQPGTYLRTHPRSMFVDLLTNRTTSNGETVKLRNHGFQCPVQSAVQLNVRPGLVVSPAVVVGDLWSHVPPISGRPQ